MVSFNLVVVSSTAEDSLSDRVPIKHVFDQKVSNVSKDDNVDLNGSNVLEDEIRLIVDKPGSALIKRGVDGIEKRAFIAIGYENLVVHEKACHFTASEPFSGKRIAIIKKMVQGEEDVKSSVNYIF